MSKCILCEKKIKWEHHLFPLPYLMHDLTLLEKYCPTCWNRIWAEWYEYPDDSDYYDLTYVSPSDEYIIKTYKGNDLVAEMKRTSKVSGDWTKVLKTKKKHWWQR